MSHMHYFLQFTRINLSPPARGSFCLYSPSCREGSFAETGVSRYAANCMSIRLVLRVVARPSDGSTYLAGSEGNTLPGWGAIGLPGQPGPLEGPAFMQEGEFPPNTILGNWAC